MRFRAIIAPDPGLDMSMNLHKVGHIRESASVLELHQQEILGMLATILKINQAHTNTKGFGWH